MFEKEAKNGTRKTSLYVRSKDERNYLIWSDIAILLQTLNWRLDSSLKELRSLLKDSSPAQGTRQGTLAAEEEGKKEARRTQSSRNIIDGR